MVENDHPRSHIISFWVSGTNGLQSYNGTHGAMILTLGHPLRRAWALTTI